MFFDNDNDGDLDLFYGTSERETNPVYYFENGKVDLSFYKDTFISMDTSFFPQIIESQIPTAPAMSYVDVDLDGELDLILSTNEKDKSSFPIHEKNNALLFLNDKTTTNPAFNFQQNDFLVGNMIDFGAHTAPVFGDLDGDGDQDMMLGAVDRENIPKDYLLINDGQGNFSEAPSSNMPARYGGANFGTVQLRAGDFDDDGDNDDVKMLDGVYIYNNVDEECFFKTPAEIEELNLSIYTYDYRTISDQVKNLVLDCKYYQVKKDGGPCINGSNITVGDDGAKCKLGFGPQPTMFNGSYACTKCLIINDDETVKNPDACWCGTGKIPELKGSTYTCEPYTAPPGNVCLDDADELHFVKFRPPGTAAAVVGEDECQHCPADMAYKREGDNITCIKCAGVARTLSSFCIEPSDVCPNTAAIKGNIAVDDGAEQELCVIDTSPEEPITRCEEGTDCSNSSLCIFHDLLRSERTLTDDNCNVCSLVHLEFNAASFH